MIKKLVIAPHADDEVLGCASILDKDTLVFYCGIDEGRVAPDPGHRIPTVDRLKEIDSCSGYLGFKYLHGVEYVNFYELYPAKDAVENLINDYKPEYIFIPRTGFNQDHNVVNQACQVATRPHDKNHFVKKVVEYESVHDVVWPNQEFMCNYYIPLDIFKKINGYKLHKSQVREHRSIDKITSLASIRGAAINVPYAEGFRILRWVE